MLSDLSMMRYHSLLLALSSLRLAIAAPLAGAATQGQWTAPITFPVVPVAAAVLPNSGNVLVWSSYSPTAFTSSPGTQTVTATYNLAAGTVSQRTITNTQHDMFCPGLSMSAQGQPFVTGGNTAPKLSIYTPGTDAWASGTNMQIARGYQASTTLSDGRIFVIGGSWNGGQGNKNGEIYNPTTNAWSLLPGCPVAPMLTSDIEGVYRQDNHGDLFGWKSGSVFQAGPSKAMNWYSTTGTGGTTPAGNRGTDTDSMCGTASMYDAVAGKILTTGGSVNYNSGPGKNVANIVTIGAPNTPASVTAIAPMSFARVFANGVVLPSGQVLIVGGQTLSLMFTDNNSTLITELFDPATNTFSQMAPITIPRNYHSTALLMLDGTVFSAGGGLCGTCNANHLDAQIWSPPYLFNADGTKATRPVINTLSATTVVVGGKITVTMNSAVTSFALMRHGSATHTVNNDQRRIPLAAGSTIIPNTYTITVPSDPGVAIPGYWMLFAFNSAKVPSVAKSILVKSS